MKRLVMMAMVKLIGEALLITIIVGIVIGVIGKLKQWDTSLAFSNAFFIAGCLVIVAGTSTKLAASQDWGVFQMISGESFRGMSGSERANFIIEASSSIRLVILGVLSGIFLILISLFFAKMP